MLWFPLGVYQLVKIFSGKFIKREPKIRPTQLGVFVVILARRNRGRNRDHLQGEQSGMRMRRFRSITNRPSSVYRGERPAGLRGWQRAGIVGVATLSALGLAVPALAVPRAASPATATPTSVKPQPVHQMPSGVRPVTPPVVPEPPSGKVAGPAAPAVVSEPAAIAQAKKTGKPVEVTADTTESSDVMANPNGTFTMTSTMQPTRTQVDGKWAAIDTNLHRNADGSFSPNATTLATTFSGGGTTPAITLSSNGDTLALSWPTALPAPQVSGSTATYPDVLPGVDLQLSADAASYREILIVHDATAAANPALAHLTLSATASGLNLASDKNNLLTATDTKTGKVIFQSSTPLMWDSSSDPHVGPAPSAASAGSGHVSELNVTSTPAPANRARTMTDGAQETSAATITVTPPAAALTGPGVHYPLYVDPEMDQGSQNWAEVTSNGWHYFDPAQLAQVGDCGSWSGCNGLQVARTYFTMPTPALDNGASTARVFSADFYISEQHNAAGCGTPEPVQLDEANPIDSNTTWPGPDTGAVLGTSTSSASEGCAANIPPIYLTDFAQSAANNHWPNLTMDLRAPDEGNQNQWKQFYVGAGSPELVVVYSYPPNAATGLGAVNAVNCNGTSYVPDGPTTLYGSATDNNSPPLNPTLNFEVSNNNFASDVAAGTATVASGTSGTWNAGSLAPGNYQVRVAVDNAPGSSQDMWAGTYSNYNFTRLSAPTVAPTVATGQYPDDYWGEPTDNPGGIGVIGNGAANLAGYTWTLQGAGTEPVPAANECNYSQTFSGGNGITGGFVPATAGNASFNLPAGLSVGYHTIYVRGFDLAHNLTPESQAYKLYVAAPLGTSVSHWQEAESTAFSQPAGQNSTLASQANCCGVQWSNSAQLLFQGTAQGQSFSMPFTVAASTNYVLNSSITKGPDYGILSMTLDGAPLLINGQKQFDGYSATVTTQYVGIGSVYLTSQTTHTITVTMVGTNPASLANHYVAGIDGFWLQGYNQLDSIEPVTQYSSSDPHAVQAIDESGKNIAPTAEANDNGMGFLEGNQLLYPATAAGQSVRLEFDAPVEADYALGVTLTNKSNYGQLEFAEGPGNLVLDNSKAAPIDTYSATEWAGYVPLGGVHLTAGPNYITVTVVGKNANSSGFQLGIEDLTVAAVNNVTASSFTSAMNNHGITTDGSNPGANFDLVGDAWSAQAMTAAGIAPGSSFTTGGATFQIPAEGNATTNDNVIAYGQTIPFPASQRLQASAVGLLVSSTCNWSPEAPTTITYTNGTTSNPQMPRVPDWVYGDDDSATVVTQYLDYGNGVAAQDKRPHLYAVFLPTNPSLTLSSITLPYTGSAQLSDSCNTGPVSGPALHVFSIAPKPASDGAAPNGQSWLGSWAGPVDAAVTPPGGRSFAGQTVRMVVHPTTSGAYTRIRLSNQDTMSPVTIGAATVAAQAGSTRLGAATLATPTAVTFGGKSSVTLPAGAEVDSDPVATPSPSGGSGNLVVSLYVPSSTAKTPMHGTATAGAYLSNENDTTNVTGTPFTVNVTGDYFLTGVDESTANTANGTVAVLGDQLTTAGAVGGSCGGGSAYGCSWVDDLATTPGANVPGSVVNVSRAGTPAQDQWKLTDGSGTTAADSQGSYPATASGGVTWSGAWSGSVPGSAVLNGSSASLATSGPVLNTQDSFTISAWVNPAQLGSTFQTYVVQQAGTDSGLYLEYDGGTGDWSFSRVETDTIDPVVDRAESSAPAKAGVWTHLAGTFSQGTGQMVLYVNGADVGETVDNTPIAATGPFVIGHGYFDGAADNYASGSVANVQVYQRMLGPLDVAELWDAAAPQQPAPGAGAPTPLMIGSSVDNSTQALPNCPSTILTETLGGQPNLRTVIVALGANDVLNDVSLATIEKNLTAITSSTRAFGLENLHRADGSRIHVLLTTVPPLGLGANDPREPIREQLNSDIMHNAGDFDADGYINFDSALQSTAGQVPAALLTNGLPNATYYQDLANAVVNAISTFPPTAQL
jgi:hypothetical protein